MAQPTGQSGGKNPLGITSFWPSTLAEPPMLWEFWFNRFIWGMVAKHSINPRNFYYASTLTAAQLADLPEEVDGKNRLVSEQTLISNLYLCLGRKDRMSYIKENHTWISLQQGILEFWILSKPNFGRNETKLTKHSNYWHNYRRIAGTIPLSVEWAGRSM